MTKRDIERAKLVAALEGLRGDTAAIAVMRSLIDGLAHPSKRTIAAFKRTVTRYIRACREEGAIERAARIEGATHVALGTMRARVAS